MVEAAWLEHVRNQGPAWLCVALSLTHLLCCRITEIMRLTAESFDHEKKCVTIEALKRQAATTKPLSEAACLVTESLRDYGVSVQRARRNGARGHAVYLDTWMWPETGLLFPATRKDSTQATTARTSWRPSVGRFSSTLVPPDGAGSVRIENIVSHCGRHRCSNGMKSFGIKR